MISNIFISKCSINIKPNCTFIFMYAIMKHFVLLYYLLFVILGHRFSTFSVSGNHLEELSSTENTDCCTCSQHLWLGRSVVVLILLDFTFRTTGQDSSKQWPFMIFKYNEFEIVENKRDKKGSPQLLWFTVIVKLPFRL